MGGRRRKFKKPKPGIYIIGEGITEQHYFSHLKLLYGFTCTIRPRFFGNMCAGEMKKKIEELLKSDVTIVCVFDADVTIVNEKERTRIQKLQNKYSKNKNVYFCDSFPSIEYWFLLHFRDICPHFSSSREVINKLKKYIRGYEKTEDFLKNSNWVKEMSMKNGSLESAIIRAKKYPTTNPSYSKVYIAIQLLN